jgi:hypothetical protein
MTKRGVKINNMSKGKVSIKIEENNFQFIDGATGEKLTKEQIERKYGTGIQPKVNIK